jgi:hypothetical protein
MAQREDIEAYRASLAALSVAAQSDLRRFWGLLDPLNRTATREALIEFLTEIVEGYGDAASVLASDFFEVIRAEVTDDFFTPALAVPPPPEQVSASTRWALGGLFVPNDQLDTSAVLANLEKVADRLTKLPARETFASALEADPLRPRYARVPSGAVTCRFCAMLASRGAVYLSEDTAGGSRRFHDHCDCVPVAVWEGQDLPAGFDPGHYEEIYRSSDTDLSDRSTRVPTAN